MRQLGMAVCLVLALGQSACDDGAPGSIDIERSASEAAADPLVPEAETDLPGAITVYPGARVVANTRVVAGTGMGRMVTMTIDAAPDEVAGFYRRQAQAAGVTIEDEVTVGGAKILGGEAENGLTINLSASPREDGGTSANLMVGEPIGD